MQRKVKLYHYQLPLDCAMILRGQSVSVREGWIIQLEESTDSQVSCQNNPVTHIGRGEIAPLPGFSIETAAQAKQQLDSVIRQWLEQGTVELDLYCPSVAFGFSMALLELEDGLQKAIYSSNRHHHFASALLLAADHRLISTKHAQLVTTSLCKLKIASQATPEAAIHDGEIARQLLQKYPKLRLRLDANQRWDLTSALAFANQVPPELRPRIDFIEEPCGLVCECLEFSHQTGIAIAWDESLRDADQCKLSANPKRGGIELIRAASTGYADFDAANVAAIVIKPMLTGCLSYCGELINQAHKQGLTVVISSSLESSFGLLQLAHLSTWLTPNATPGLDTVHVFKHQIAMPWPGCDLPLLVLTTLPCAVYSQSRTQHRIVEVEQG
ncbi:o-succinylbenzoate synthase [Moritella sp. 24]|uniref:o-succinylbenzoate synthase n=1 Tax=Moritella sp. 24 TaxID=2746230 RepID=UPI001BAB5422|nr:o-succinylbenzoate synthase [Moritella sp. 24]QUM77076.1 o-succinylbenzoate synthase [Moritella sp. 24]